MESNIIVSRNPVAALGFMLGRPSDDGSGHIGNVFREDDAQLFAAAPRMLAALQEIGAEIEARADEENPAGASSPNELAARIAIKARSAIVEATGAELPSPAPVEEPDEHGNDPGDPAYGSGMDARSFAEMIERQMRGEP